MIKKKDFYKIALFSSVQHTDLCGDFSVQMQLTLFQRTSF